MFCCCCCCCKTYSPKCINITLLIFHILTTIFSFVALVSISWDGFAISLLLIIFIFVISVLLTIFSILIIAWANKGLIKGVHKEHGYKLAISGIVLSIIADVLCYITEYTLAMDIAKKVLCLFGSDEKNDSNSNSSSKPCNNKGVNITLMDYYMECVYLGLTAVFMSICASLWQNSKNYIGNISNGVQMEGDDAVYPNGYNINQPQLVYVVGTQNGIQEANPDQNEIKNLANQPNSNTQQ